MDVAVASGNFIRMYRKSIVLLVVHLLSVFMVFSQASHIDSLRKVIKRHNAGDVVLKDTAMVNRYNELARAFFTTYPDSMRFYAMKALSLSESVDYLKGKAHAYRLIGIAHYAVGENHQAIDNYKLSAELSLEIEYLTNLASNYNNIAIIYDLWGEYETSLEYYLRSLEINKEIGYERGIAYNLINVGLIYHNLGRILQALNTQMEALVYVAKLNDKNGQALVYHNLGGIYSDLDKLDESLEKFYKSMQLRKEINDLAGLSSTFHNIGIVLLAKNEPDSARLFYERALDAAERSNNLRFMPNIFISLGDIAMDAKNYALAMDYFDRAYEISVNMDDQFRIANALKKKAQIYHLRGINEKAIELAEQAMIIARNIENKKLQMYVSKTLSVIYESKGSIPLAFSYFKSYTAIADSLNNFEIQRRSARLDAEYEYLQKETELLLQKTEMELANRNRLNRQLFFTVLSLLIALFLGIILILNQKNRKQIEAAFNDLVARNLKIAVQKEQLERQAKELEDASKAKNRIFSVISHDLRGPLSYAVMAVDMAMKKDEGFLHKNLPLIKTNLDNVYALTQSLLEWAKVQMKKEAILIEDMDVSAMISNGLLGLNSQLHAKQLKVSLEIPRQTMVKGDKNILELVIRNLLSNAVKFSHPEGVVDIGHKIQEERTIVSIADQGVGIEDKVMEKLFDDRALSRAGTANEKGLGMGLKLSREFLAKIDGELWLESEKGKGTTAFISLPTGVNSQT